MFCPKRKKEEKDANENKKGMQRGKVVVQQADKASIIGIFQSENKQMNQKKEMKSVVDGEIWVVNNFFSPNQCKELIKFAESRGFEEALVNIGNGMGMMNKDFRDCNRVMVDDVESAHYLAEQLRPYVPLCQEGAVYDGMNERFRVLKYNKNQKFALHMDGIWSPTNNIFSVLTIQFYLNTVNKGGSTRFEWEGWETKDYNCKSEEGKAVIFRQSGWWHEGTHVLEGTKYTVRNDLMYKAYDKKEWKNNLALQNKECGLCQKKIKTEELGCGHLFLYCGCHAYYNGDIHRQPQEVKKYRKCCQCGTRIANPSEEVYKIL